MKLNEHISWLYQERSATYTKAEISVYKRFIDELNRGNVRAAEKIDGIWKVNKWVKEGILLGFRIGKLVEYPLSEHKSFFDKDSIPEKHFVQSDGVRIVPGGSSARTGCFVAPGVTIMPPAYINIGAFVDENTMIDSHALVGSCAQIGKRVHLSAGAMIGGVLEPIGSRPVIIEDDAFIGGNTGIYEGIIIQERAVIASGTIINSSTPIYDCTRSIYLSKDEGGSYTIPIGAVVVPGSRRLSANPDFQIYCPIIIKYRDAKTDSAVVLERELRTQMD